MVIDSGDVLNVRFHYNPELNKTVRVRDDGKVSLDFFQGIQAAGQTPEELQKKLVKLYSHEFTDPEVTVDIESRANNCAYVTGEVALPGMKELHAGMTVAAVLAMSQITQKTAAVKAVILIRQVAPSEYKAYKINASLLEGAASEFQVAPGDILFVPRKGIVKADDFIEQYVRQLLPGTPSTAVDLIYTAGSATPVVATAAGH
jgi:protein involved in polysaccharide export with SLBB domain